MTTAIATSPPSASLNHGTPTTQRAAARGVLAGAVVPLVAFHLVRNQASSDATALMLAGCFPAAWVALQWARTRRIDPIAAISLAGFIVGVAGSELLGGSALVLKLRDSAFTAAFGVACLVSLVASRPMMFRLGKAMSTGDDPQKQAAYDALWSIPGARRVFARLTIMWGVGMLTEAGLRVVLALTLPTSTFLIASPALAVAMFGGLFAVTAHIARRAQQH